MANLTVADELEFESWPEEKRELAKRYLAEHFERECGSKEVWAAAYDYGFERGKIVGFNLGKRANDGEQNKEVR